MHDSEIQEIIAACHLVAEKRGITLPPITIDRSPIARFIAKDPVAILTNKSSNMMARSFAAGQGMEAPHWEPGRVMCISDVIANAHEQCMFAIGVIVHEVGHAFNIAASLPNTESNAQIFEIETLIEFSERGTKMPGNHQYSNEQLDEFFRGRIPSYISNDPTTSGYVTLHSKLRELPTVFSKTHDAYNSIISNHIITHRKRNSKNFEQILQELESASPLSTRLGPQPTIKVSAVPQSFFPTKVDTSLFSALGPVNK